MKEGDQNLMEGGRGDLEIAGARQGSGEGAYGSFGNRVRQARARPNSTSIRDLLLADDRYTGM